MPSVLTILKISLCLASICGTAVAGIIMYASFQHNMQGEIHQNGVIDWPYWLLIGSTGFAASFLVIAPISVVTLYLGTKVGIILKKPLQLAWNRLPHKTGSHH